MADSFRMNTSGDKAHREKELEDAMALFDKATKSGAVMATIDFAKSMDRALKQAAHHPDMTKELAEILSTRHYQLEYEIQQRLTRPTDE